MAATNKEDSAVGCVGMKKKDSLTNELLHLSVDFDYRGHGIAKKLTKALIEESRQRNYSFVYLTTTSAQDPAIKLYESFGFQVDEIIDEILGSSIHGLKVLGLLLNLNK